MGRIGIATFAFRLAAIYVWIQALLQVLVLPALLAMSDANLGRTSLTGYLVAILLHAIFGAILWLVSGRLARRIFGMEEGRPLRGTAEVGSLALCIAGIWLLDMAIHKTWNVIFSARTASLSGTRLGLFAEIAAFAVLTLAALTLLLASGRIAKRMFPSAEGSSSIAADLQPIAFSVLGLVILMKSLPNLLSNLFGPGGWAEDGDGMYIRGADPAWPIHVATLLRVALGLALFLGGRQLAGIWRWAQTAGLDRRSTSGPGARTGPPPA